MRIVGIFSGLLLAGVLTGCGASGAGQFQPRVATTSAKATYPASAYKLRVGQQTVGDAKVWSETKQDPERRVDVRVQVRNLSGEPLNIDANQAKLKVTTYREGTLVVPQPTRIEGTATVAPDSTGEVKLAYDLPPGVSAGDVTGFRVVWQVKTPAGAESKHATEFIPTAWEPVGGACPDGQMYASLDACRGWVQGQWWGYDNPNDPAMPASGGVMLR